MLIAFMALVLQDDGWQVKPRVGVWAGDESHTRLRSMEQEAIAKGGTGRGTYFDYDDAGADGLSFIPSLDLFVTKGADQFMIGGFSSAGDGTVTLESTLEYDGDLHFAGERMRSKFSMVLLELGYARRVMAGDVDFWLGARIVRFDWKGSLETISSVTPPTDLQSDEVIQGYKLPVLTAEIEWRVSGSVSLGVEAAFSYGFTLRRGLSATQNADGMLRLTASVLWTTGGFSAGAGLGYFALDSVSFEHQDETDLLNYRMVGLRVSVAYRF